MKIVIAPDSFKGSLSSHEAALAMEAGIKRVLPRARCIKVAMADGGEGTVTALLEAAGGSLVSKRVHGPVFKPVTARYGLLADGRTAVIEMAAASGLGLVRGKEQNPLKTGTYGTGELITDALDKGVGDIIIGMGGSATCDGGAGMAQALGIRFFDKNERLIPRGIGGGGLGDIGRIDLSLRHPGVNRARVIIACDVDNPLSGRHGAARVFGPQKGATLEMVRRLEKNLRHYTRLIKRDIGVDVAAPAGAGAAGGLAAGLLAFTRAEIRNGVEVITDANRLQRHIRGADLVITGEGSVDEQTLSGKVPVGVARIAGRMKVPVVVIGGVLADNAGSLFEHGVDGIESSVARIMTLEQALIHSRNNLMNATERALRLILIGKRMK